MNLIADRLKSIKPSPTISISTKAKELRAQGKDVIGLSAGEPDFDTPDWIKEAAYQAMKDGQTKYTAVDGTPELKDAVIDKFQRDNNLTYQRENITVGTGAKQVLYNAFMATLNEGDEVIIPAPYWVSYPDMVALAGGSSIPVTCSDTASFKLQPEQLEAAITKNTKWLILNSPSNPSGAAYTGKEIESIAEILIKHPQVHIMSDDIYEHITYDGFTFVTPAQIAPELLDRTLTINGVSKSYAMTGWRIGFAGGPKDLIKSMAILQSQSTSNPCSISQAATIAALNGPQDFLQERVNTFKKRRDFVVDKLNAIEGLSCLTPEGAFYVFPNCKALMGKTTPAGKTISSCTDVGTYLLDEALIAVVPGCAFGLDGYFRISYATSDEILDTALERIAEAVNRLT